MVRKNDSMEESLANDVLVKNSGCTKQKERNLTAIVNKDSKNWDLVFTLRNGQIVGKEFRIWGLNKRV